MLEPKGKGRSQVTAVTEHFRHKQGTYIVIKSRRSQEDEQARGSGHQSGSARSSKKGLNCQVL